MIGIFMMLAFAAVGIYGAIKGRMGLIYLGVGGAFLSLVLAAYVAGPTDTP